jgi:tripartite-type tricarboxylate transporter receptor subunit TctC
VHPSLPARSLAELIALARANPGTLNYASYGSGSQPHLAAEMLKAKAGIDIVHIPYKGISLAVPAVIAGEVQMTFSGIATGRRQVEAGRLRALAIGGPKRSPLLPDVPTFTELGYPEVETHAWFGLFVPAGTPRAAVDRIYRDTAAILNDPAFREKEIVQKGYDLVASSPEDFAAYIVRDREARGRAVKISGAKAE